MATDRRSFMNWKALSNKHVLCSGADSAVLCQIRPWDGFGSFMPDPPVGGFGSFMPDPPVGRIQQFYARSARGADSAVLCQIHPWGIQQFYARLACPWAARCVSQQSNSFIGTAKRPSLKSIEWGVCENPLGFLSRTDQPRLFIP